MPLYGFDRRFVPLVLAGTKTQTIRARGKRPKPSVGGVAHCYADPRRQSMRLLGRWPIVKVSDIRFEIDSRLRVWVDGAELTLCEMEMLFHRDGFVCPGERLGIPSLRRFFLQHQPGAVALATEFIQERLKLPFLGYLIEWDFDRSLLRTGRKKEGGVDR